MDCTKDDAGKTIYEVWVGSGGEIRLHSVHETREGADEEVNRLKEFAPKSIPIISQSTRRK